MKAELIEKLKPYIGEENPNLPEYTWLDSDLTFLTSEYSRRIPKNCSHEMIQTQLKRALKGSLLIDPGCGPGNYTSTFNVAVEQGVKTYIGVDLALDEESIDKVEDTEEILVRSDMLRFIAQINSGVANFVFNGIDFLRGNYLDYVVNEIERATKEGGLVFGVGSEPIVDELKNRESFYDLNAVRYSSSLWHRWEEEGEQGKPPFMFSRDFFLFIKNTEGKIREYVPEFEILEQ